MFIRIGFLLVILASSDGVLYSSFWAPLFNPRILNYRVDAAMDPDAGKGNREAYVNNYGARGERLIADLGNGKGPADIPLIDKGTEDVKFYYTYPGAQTR
ncbi:uncharacterized protein LOC114355375 [Ostrinia furnacalis]|uniref:uncharacterized protein LOC114355375 n=1 Tax=Ostrinia furnacalis TaxID=93504 RepID=UPI00103D43E8|nr:uncharacterized protein LOC114355375 [Ostrinia furnacalis]